MAMRVASAPVINETKTIMAKAARLLCIACATLWFGCAVGFCALGYVDYMNNVGIREEVVEVTLFIAALLVSLWALTIANKGQLKLAFAVGGLSAFCAVIATVLILIVGHLCSSAPLACQDTTANVIVKAFRVL